MGPTHADSLILSNFFSDDQDSTRLDTLARQPLWQAGLDYKHRSGHGVGHFLKVHESPDIGPRYEKEPGSWLKEGMTVTINPGYYNEGKWGIRIKNTYEVANETVPSGEHFLGFEALTLVPIQTNLIDKKALTDKEVRILLLDLS
ncbi:hypothetical protein OESDEN_19337 [Oesophagostomum dentatum]|uniref:Peptidase M24 domain-containing protein n=1 Tax=Oesophagostomum dentatum TaxID=61180 RepID=A0A0B1SBQ6_OESDE|nr:hypothetical protein OESDEN_19337 [Oesophagostomum dentatum]